MDFGAMIFAFLFFTFHAGAFYIYPLSSILFPDSVVKGFVIICIFRLLAYIVLGPIAIVLEIILEFSSAIFIWPRMGSIQKNNANNKIEQKALIGVQDIDQYKLNQQKEIFKNKVLEYADALMVKNLPKLEKICTSNMYNNISLLYKNLNENKRIKIFEITDIDNIIFSEYKDNKVSLQFDGKGCDYTLLYDGRPFGNSGYKNKIYTVELIKKENDWLINSIS